MWKARDGEKRGEERRRMAYHIYTLRYSGRSVINLKITGLTGSAILLVGPTHLVNEQTSQSTVEGNNLPGTGLPACSCNCT
jgi:hypothetical protein